MGASKNTMTTSDEHLCEIKRSNYHSKKTYYQEQQRRRYQERIMLTKSMLRKSKKITCDCGKYVHISYGYKDTSILEQRKHQDWLNKQNEE